MRLLLTTAQISKIFLRALPPNPLIYLSCLHSIDHEITTHYFALRPPYLSFLFTFNRLWDHYSLQHKSQYIPEGFAPRPPYLSFLFTFNRLWDYYSLQRKYQKFSWRISPQTPLTILTSHYFVPRPSYLSFLFTFNRLWDYYALQCK